MARPRGNKWQGDALVDGRRVRRSFDTQGEAEAWEKRMDAGLPEGAPNTLKAFVADQFDHIWTDMKTKSVKNTNTNLEHAYQFFGADATLASINSARIAEYIVRLKDKRFANGTINSKLSTLSKLLRRASRLDVIQTRPEIDFLPQGKGRQRVLTEIEEKQLVERAFHLGMETSGHLINFLLYTGCRLGEAFKVGRHDTRHNGYVMFRNTKNGDDRSVRLVGPAKSSWDWAYKSTDADRPWQALCRGSFRHHWNYLRDDLGHADDPEFVPHMLRHTCATRLVVSNVALPKVKEWMGHRNITTTMRYAHLAPQDLDDCAKALSNFG